MKVMLLFFEDGDEEAFLKVQRLIQSESHMEPLESKTQSPSSTFEIRKN